MRIMRYLTALMTKSRRLGKGYLYSGGFNKWRATFYMSYKIMASAIIGIGFVLLLPIILALIVAILAYNYLDLFLLEEDAGDNVHDS